MSVSVEMQAILLSLAPLFKEAEEKELWFFHESNEAGEIWCSPEYLRMKQSEGEYVWAPEHWELRSPVGKHQCGEHGLKNECGTARSPDGKMVLPCLYGSWLERQLARAHLVADHIRLADLSSCANGR